MRWVRRTAAALGLLLGAATSAVAAPQGPIVVHHIGPFTGVLGPPNKETVAGAELYFEGLNARGGINGRPVKIETLDDGQDPKKTVELFEALAAEKKILALLLPRTTPSTEALLPAVGKHGIPVVGPQTGGSFVNQPAHREVFPLRASYQKEAEVAIRQQYSIGVRSFALLLADDAYGRDTRIAIDRVFKELGVEPVAVAKFDNRKPDVTEPIRTVLAGRPQVVLLVSSARAAADFVKGYTQQGGRATFIALSNASTADFVTWLGDQARGVIVMQIMPSPFASSTALTREYAAAAAKKQVPLSYAGLFGYASGKLLALGLLRAGASPTPASLTQALEALGDFDMGGYRLRYGPGDRTGSTYVDASIISVGGKFLR